MDKNYLILNINAKNKGVEVQVNRQDKLYKCYNLSFELDGDYFCLVLEGFMVPTFSGSWYTSIYGTHETRTLQHCLKILPKLKDDHTDILTFLAALIKKEKLNHFQINVNSDFGYSQAKKVDMATIATIQTELNHFEIPTKIGYGN